MNNPLSQSFELARDEGSGLGDIEMGQSHLNSTELGLEDFHKQVRVIEKDIQKLSDLLKKLQDANEESKSVTRAADMKAVKRQMEKETDEALKVARVAKSKIEELDRDNLASRKKPGCGKGSSTDRTRTAQTVALRKKLKERMTDFQVEGAVSHVQSGVNMLHKARKLQKNTRKCTFIAIIILLIIVLVIVLAVIRP